MAGSVGSNDDREADRPARPPLTSKGLLAVAALAMVGVIGVLALLRHGIAVPFAQHVEQVSQANRQTAPAPPTPQKDDDEPTVSETVIEILGPAEVEPPEQAFPAPEEFAKLLAPDEPAQPSPSAQSTPQAKVEAAKEVVALDPVRAQKPGEAAPDKAEAAKTTVDLPAIAAPEMEGGPTQVVVEGSLEDTETTNVQQERAEPEKIAEAPSAGPDYWVGVMPRPTANRDQNERGSTDEMQTMALLQASARGSQPPAPWATQPPAPAMTAPPAPWATQPPAPAMTAPPAPWATQPPAPAMTAPPAPWATQPPAPAMTAPPAPWATQPPAPAMTPPPAPWATQPPYPAGSSPPSPGLTPPPGGSLFAQPPIGGTLNRGSDRQRRERR